MAVGKPKKLREERDGKKTRNEREREQERNPDDCCYQGMIKRFRLAFAALGEFVALSSKLGWWLGA